MVEQYLAIKPEPIIAQQPITSRHVCHMTRFPLNDLADPNLYGAV